MDLADLLRRYLNLFWLRPENALWTVLRSLAWSRVPMPAPSLDLSCGDGTFSFIHAGGAFAPDFDVFQTVAKLDKVTREQADMFDKAADDTYQPTIERRPTWRIEVGTDLKASSLSRAARLDFYDKLVEHDNENPLPFADNEFASVYCNSAKWVRGVDAFLREIARVTRPGGTIVLHCKLDSIARYTLSPFRDQLGDNVLRILDRGRLDTWPSLASDSEWRRRFSAAGLRLVNATPLATRTHAHFWDVGLRPIAPMLVRMANEITPASRLEIKRDWVALFEELLLPLCRLDFDLFPNKSEPSEMQYVLEVGK